MLGSAHSHQIISTLYTNHYAWLQSWLRKKLGTSHEAADLAQDTFLRLINKDRELQSLREPKAYLTTVAHGLLVNHWRRQAIEHAYLEALSALPEPMAQSPEEKTLILEILEQIATLLDGLSIRTQQIFLLSQLDGLTYPQIAKEMGLTVNVVQKAMTKAMTHCYEVLYA
ncbi:sigma-70 family RNA polymerase sigma factor [Methylobacillus gramineus]|uniref:sigma-70 family RNA polymerase sigma factor n=1 Tax=Methylobacillus gramineus TaxID=755169 RepID=UPI001CFF8A61|nr:sigma-70 family RNA polymerase sigma factor [Methylobacillus gramineus]MCB5184805.1 sigma-70 family RNA polymerase sigma factor [Methylobacillus gramineus]